MIYTETYMALKARNTEISEPVDLAPKPRSKIAWWTISSSRVAPRGAESGHDVKDWLQADFGLVTDPSKAAGE